MLIDGLPRSFQMGDAATPLVTDVAAGVPLTEVEVDPPDAVTVSVQKQSDLATLLSIVSSLIMVLRSI